MTAGKIKKKGRIGLLIILVLVLVICVFAYYKTKNLSAERESLEGQLAQIESQIERENRRNTDITNEIKYRNTDDYIEDQARDIFGLRGKDETIFKPGDPEENKTTDKNE